MMVHQLSYLSLDQHVVVTDNFFSEIKVQPAKEVYGVKGEALELTCIYNSTHKRKASWRDGQSKSLNLFL